MHKLQTVQDSARNPMWTVLCRYATAPAVHCHLTTVHLSSCNCRYVAVLLLFLFYHSLDYCIPNIDRCICVHWLHYWPWDRTLIIRQQFSGTTSSRSVLTKHGNNQFLVVLFIFFYVLLPLNSWARRFSYRKNKKRQWTLCPNSITSNRNNSIWDSGSQKM